jgi:hypothetical protein
MTELTRGCTCCKGTGIDPASDPSGASCRVCGGSLYEFTQTGEELRKFILALLGDDEFQDKIGRFVQLVKRDLRHYDA